MRVFSWGSGWDLVNRMFTKLAMIEEALKKKRQAEENDNQQDQGTSVTCYGCILKCLLVWAGE